MCEPSDLVGIIDVFSREAASLLAEIAGAVDRRDAGGVREVAHKFKGGAASLGARRLSTLAERLQRLDGAEDVDFVVAGRLVGELEAALPLTHRALVSMTCGPGGHTGATEG